MNKISREKEQYIRFLGDFYKKTPCRGAIWFFHTEPQQGEF